MIGCHSSSFPKKARDNHVESPGTTRGSSEPYDWFSGIPDQSEGGSLDPRVQQHRYRASGPCRDRPPAVQALPRRG